MCDSRRDDKGELAMRKVAVPLFHFKEGLGPMTDQELEEIARGNIERHLGDVAADYDSAEDAVDAIYDEAYTLAFDALHDAGIPDAKARAIASSIAQCYAQP